MATGDLIDLSGDLPAFAEPAGPVKSFSTLTDKLGAIKLESPAFNVVVSEQTLKSYSEALDTIKKLTSEGVDSWRSQEAHSRLEHTKAKIVNTQSLLQKLRKIRDEETKEYAKLAADKWYPGKIIKGREAHEEKTDAKEQALRAAEADVEQYEALLAQMEYDASSLAQKCQDFDSKIVQLARAKQYEAQVVEQIFSGDAGDDKENELEKACVASQQTLTTLGTYRAAYGRVQQELKTALQNGKQAEAAMQQALRMAGADVAQDFLRPMPMRNSPGGMMIDAKKRQCMEAGNHQLHAAAEHLIQAKQMMPSLPHIDLEKVKQIHAHPGVMMDMVFDNMMVDMRSKRLIEQQLQDIQWLNREIATALNWVEQWLHYRIDRDYADAEAKYSMQKSQLDEHRRDIMQKLIAKSHK